MYDLSQRKYIFQPKVKDLIAVLEGENPEAILTVDGLDEFFIHTTSTTGIGNSYSDPFVTTNVSSSSSPSPRSR